MGLMDARIEALQCQREVDRVDVIKVVTSERETRERRGGDQNQDSLAAHQSLDLPVSSTAVRSRWSSCQPSASSAEINGQSGGSSACVKPQRLNSLRQPVPRSSRRE